MGMVYSYHNIWTVRTRILIDTGTHREENGFMDGIKYAVVRGKSLRLLGKNESLMKYQNPEDVFAR